MKKIILCSGAQHLQQDFDSLGYETFVSMNNYDDKRFFMNSDIYSLLPVESFSGEDVAVVQSASLSQYGGEWYTTQDRVFELLEFLSLLKEPHAVTKTGHKEFSYDMIDGPSSVDVVYTCMPCAKQDHACITGEVNSAKLALDLTLSMCDTLHIVDPHPPESLPWFGEMISSGRVRTVSMVQQLLEAAQKEMPDAVILGPDEGSQKRLGIQSFSKSRISSVESTISGSFDVDGCDVLIVDDMVLSGGTLRKTREKLLDLGAERIGAALTHAMPVWGGEDNLKKIKDAFGGLVFVSDTVYSETFKDASVSCVGEISSHLG